MTTAASVAWGIWPMRGASTSRVSRVARAVMAPARRERAPARRLTAVCEVPPPAVMVPKNAPKVLASPVASSSRFGRTGGSPLAVKALPAAIVSVKLIRAIPRAPGHRCSTRARSGRTRPGRPRGRWPTAATPRSARPNRRMPRIPAAAAMSGAGAVGRTRSSPTSRMSMTAPTARVGSEVSGTAWSRAPRLWKKPSLTKWTPSSLGIWSRTITRPMPALKPTSTGSEMKLATKPRRNSPASMSIAPTSRVRVAQAVIRAAGSPSGTTRCSWAATRIARVVVVLTLSGREVPNRA